MSSFAPMVFRVLVAALFFACCGAGGKALAAVEPEKRGGAETAYRVLAEVAASAVDLDPLLVQAVIEVESGWMPGAVSVDGAVGLMQIMPSTGGDYADDADLTDPVTNLRIGVVHLARLVRQFGVVRALGAWNAGEGALVRHRVFERYGETRKFVARVLVEWERLRRSAGVRMEVPDDWEGGVSRMADPFGPATAGENP